MYSASSPSLRQKEKKNVGTRRRSSSFGFESFLERDGASL